jgi:hypothetical protein
MNLAFVGGLVMEATARPRNTGRKIPGGEGDRVNGLSPVCAPVSVEHGAALEEALWLTGIVI